MPYGDDTVALYAATLQYIESVSSRRQTVNSIYLSINVALLTGLGYLAIVSHLRSWWVVGFAAFLTLAVLPINLYWLLALRTYRKVLGPAQDGLVVLEQSPEIGVKIRGGHFAHGVSTTSNEMALARYFLVIYPLSTVAMAVLVFLVTNHTVTAPTFP
jgi:hypothetical protein